MRTNDSDKPRVSVIIPTCDAGGSFGELLAMLNSQSLAPHEIVVVDSASTDGTADRARAAGAKVLPIDRREFDHGGTRNYAASHASGDVLVFMTQDAMPADHLLLEELTKPLRDNPFVACAYGRQLPRPDAHALERLARAFNYPAQSAHKRKADIDRLGIKTFFCSNACAAIRRETFVEMGRFPEPVIFNEDLFFAAKCVLAGYWIAYAAEARVIHSHNYTLAQQFRRFFDNGVSMRRNPWIYEYSSVNKEGSRLVRTQLRELVRSRDWLAVPMLLAESAAKYAGYQLGRRYDRLPPSWCARFSMHRGIWNKLQATQGRTLEG